MSSGSGTLAAWLAFAGVCVTSITGLLGLRYVRRDRKEMRGLRGAVEENGDRAILRKLDVAERELAALHSEMRSIKRQLRGRP